MKSRSPVSWTFLSMVIITANLWAQPPLTRSDFWLAGDSFDYVGINAQNLEPGPAGNGVTWNFANITRDGTFDGTIKYINASEAPNVASFSGANIAQVAESSEGSVYNFFTLTNNEAVEIGQDTPIGIIILSDKRTLATFPFNFNTTQTDTFGGNFQLMTQGILTDVTRQGSWTNTYDGFGTLIIEDKTYTNIRRIKSFQEVNDMSTIGGVSVTTNVKTTSYTYFSSDIRSPILNIVEGETTILGNRTFSKSATFLDVDGNTQQPTIPSRYGAHLTAQGGNFNTEIIIRNPTNEPRVLTLNPISATGTALTSVDVNLGSNATIRTLQENYFPADAVTFTSSGCNECIFTSGYRADIPDGSTAHVLQATTLRNDYYFYPGEWDLLFDGAALVNAGTGPATINATQTADDGTVLSQVTLAAGLEPGGKYLDVFNGKFVNNPNSIIKVESNEPLAVMILRISQDSRFLYQNFALPNPPVPGMTRWLAHITRDTGGFETSIIAHNRGDDQETVSLQPYTVGGTALPMQTITVNANSVVRLPKSSILSSDTSHAQVMGDSPSILVSVGYQSTQEDSSTAQIHEAAPVGTVFYIYPGEWDYLFDGLAIVNVGDANASVLATQIRDEDGLTVGAISLNADLVPNGKYLAILEGMLAPNPNAIIKIESTQPMAILALRLSKDNRFLYGNSTIQ